MINKVMKEYVEELNNKESNYEAILSKMKGERKMKSNMKKVLNVAMLIIVVILLGTASTGIYAKIQWDIKFKEYQNKEREYGVGTIKQAFESGYGEEVEMEYVKHDGIEAKVDSLIITDDYFEANINFNFDEDIEVNSETFGYGFAVYDENKNVYGISPRMYINKKKKEITIYH